MKKLNLKISILALGLVFLGACKKEKQDDIKKDYSHCTGCIHFDTTSINYSLPNGKQYDGSFFYESHGVKFDDEFEDHTMQNFPSSSILTMQLGPSSGWGTNNNSNFKNNIFVTADNNVRLDFSSISYKSKKIEFDVSGLPLGNPVNAFQVNGAGSNTVPLGITIDYQPLLNGYHVVIIGEVNTLIWYGFEVGYDNLCVVEHQTNPVTTQCIDFNDTLFEHTILTSQSGYGSILYEKNEVKFRAGYKDYIMMNLDGDLGSRNLSSSGFDGENPNFTGNVLVLGNTELQLALPLKGQNKKVEFDISLQTAPTEVNYFRVNNSNVNTLPTGVVYTYVKQTKGYHVTITGPISEIYLRGFEIAYDNLCITQ